MKSGEYYWVWYHYMLGARRYDEQESRNVRPAVGETFAGRAAAVVGRGTIYPRALRAGEVLSLAAMAIFWNGVLSLFLYIAWVVPIRQRRLVRHGTATPGTITGKRKSGGKGVTYTVSYRFEFWGKEWSGKCDVDSAAYERAHEGMAVTVLYDPERPKRSLVYELSDFVVEGKK